MNEFKIQSSDLDFRVKKMNAIEILAVRANISATNTIYFVGTGLAGTPAHVP